MTTKNETRNEELQLDEQKVDNCTPKQIPSIWYT
jgi:hypothetical protein